jgi:tRNA-splicing ligase RtcB
MNGHDLLQVGYESGKALSEALKAFKAGRAQGLASKVIKAELVEVLADPEKYAEHVLYQRVAEELLRERRVESEYDLNTPRPYQIWGKNEIEPGAIDQMERAIRLPVTVKGALMPDAHVGYGLPIGGVVAVDNAVIPYAVGVDIACRMRLTIYDTSPFVLGQKREKFREALERNTRFGTGFGWKPYLEHPVLDDSAWNDVSWLKTIKLTAAQQLGSSGSGNHFVVFGALKVSQPIVQGDQTVPPGEYLALLSHSGSRRVGYEIAGRYTNIAMAKRSGLPKDYSHLSWLTMDEHEGQEYWIAMNLAGRYASANHQLIHEMVTHSIRFPILGSIENHHNFAWKEQIDGQDLYVHRKGATPAGEGVLGIIPGSMGTSGFVVSGRGNPESLNSASHGAGRRMSRSQAVKQLDWNTVKHQLKRDGVELISAGLDEAPNAYKDIHAVMAAQQDLVSIVAEFQPKMVKMDGSGSKAED